MELKTKMMEDCFSRMAQTIEEFSEAWHVYRVSLLLACLGSFLVTQLWIYGRRLWIKPSSALSAAEQNHTWNDQEKRSVTSGKDKSELLGRDLNVQKSDRNNVKSGSVPKRIIGLPSRKRTQSHVISAARLQPMIFYFSLTGTTEEYATALANDLRVSLAGQEQVSNISEPQLHDLSYIDYDEFFTSIPKPVADSTDVRYFYLLLLPSYNIDTMLSTFLSHLQEVHYDFRINTGSLSSLAGYSVFGFGDRQGWSSEQEGFCFQAVEVDKWMAKLTLKKRAFPLGLGDVKSDVQERLKEWGNGIVKTMSEIAASGNLGEGLLGSGDALESDEEETEEAEFASGKGSARKRRLQASSIVGDLEDIAGRASSTNSGLSQAATPTDALAVDFTTYNSSPISQTAKEMVPTSSPTYAALTKQGYSIIGSHSGVKICRWTKSALRGRGSCYKYSFYGIKSHLCMETTPSLSCSNKCVFCWRHGTNPVGTTWRWKIDPPELIYAGAKEAHLKKIKTMKGVPGVRAERFQEAMKIRHCALSLVGEPIFYPRINEFVELLHADKISSFLVCNAQHPDQLEALKVVTQLYVSIDASNRESLRRVDRPLHRDFWERFMRCLDIIRVKRNRMRTVYRLTLVKGFNIEDEVEGYADLVERGLPCFIEIKGVTYCGTSSSAGAGLTMQNVPFYEEVTTFVRALEATLLRRGLEYGIAAEHAHSCCVLIGSRRFLIDGQWHTLIDYEKFFTLLQTRQEFAPEDYVGPPTPQWATWGQGGFDPSDERFYRKAKAKTKAAVIGT